MLLLRSTKGNGLPAAAEVLVFVRYYFLQKTQKVNLFADARYIYGRTCYQYNAAPGNGAIVSRTITNKMGGYAVAAGPVIFLNKNTALELTVSFTKNGDLPFMTMVVKST